MKKTIYLAMIIGLFACKGNKTTTEESKEPQAISTGKADPCATQVQTGITGNIVWSEGDFMPSPDEEPREGEPTQREVYIFNSLKRTGVKSQDGVFFFPDRDEAIAKQLSSEEGCYKIALKPGIYSVLVMEGDKGFFANSFDSRDMIQTVEIKQGELTTLNIDINYKAAY